MCRIRYDSDTFAIYNFIITIPVIKYIIYQQLQGYPCRSSYGFSVSPFFDFSNTPYTSLNKQVAIVGPNVRSLSLLNIKN